MPNHSSKTRPWSGGTPYEKTGPGRLPDLWHHFGEAVATTQAHLRTITDSKYLNAADEGWPESLEAYRRRRRTMRNDKEESRKEKQKETERNRKKQKETERNRKKQKETERNRKKQKERERKRKKEKERERGRERKGEGEGEREGEMSRFEDEKVQAWMCCEDLHIQVVIMYIAPAFFRKTLRSAAFWNHTNQKGVETKIAQ